MSSFVRKAAIGLLVLFIAVSAFGLGFLANDWWENRNYQEARPFASVREQTSTVPLAHELYQQVWTLLERDFIGDDPTETERLYGSVRGLTESYHDPYTLFVEPQPRELERDQLRGHFGGIGAWIDQEEQGFFLRPMPGQPADRAGVLEGDQLLAVDGREITAGMPVDDVTAMIRGEIDTEVCLALARQSTTETDTLSICIVRAEIQIPSVEWRLLDRELGDASGTSIGYLKQSLFSERTVEEMRTALAELSEQGADRFILDLRGNPGGLVDSAVGVADLWLDGGPIFYEQRADGDERTFTAAGGDSTNGAPLVVIVDGASASASEILAGALLDRGRAILVGEKTFGKGSVQLIHELLDGSSLHVTTARWLTAGRHEIDGIGLIPTIPVSSGDDPVIVAAAAVKEMVALRPVPTPVGQ